MNKLGKLIDDYRKIGAELERHKAEAFPAGTVVFVACYRYTGYGRVCSGSDCPADQLEVELENGNIWTYRLETISKPLHGHLPVWINEHSK